ncbi:hypothetical protein ACIP01_12645 [Pseudomonas monteilii]|uniref:hypothetical protein n=1 Tax=Pseudomonas monteilii TaxID=76759 RepID=UPI0037FE4D9B
MNSVFEEVNAPEYSVGFFAGQARYHSDAVLPNFFLELADDDATDAKVENVERYPKPVDFRKSRVFRN